MCTRASSCVRKTSFPHGGGGHELHQCLNKREMFFGSSYLQGCAANRCGSADVFQPAASLSCFCTPPLQRDNSVRDLFELFWGASTRAGALYSSWRPPIPPWQHCSASAVKAFALGRRPRGRGGACVCEGRRLLDPPPPTHPHTA